MENIDKFLVKVLVVFACAFFIPLGILGFINATSIFLSSNKPYWRDSAPNGIIQQGEWGSIDTKDNTWFFALCDHPGLGPLHGTFHVTNETLETLTLERYSVYPETSFHIKYDAYPENAELYLKLENNVIIEAWIR